MLAKEIETGFQKVWQLFQENEKRFKETDRILTEKFKEAAEQSKETGKKVAETTAAVNALTGKWSRFVEGLIAPATIRLFEEKGILVDKVYQRVKGRKKGVETEIDILAINGEYAILIEAKSTLKIEDVNDHLARLEKFKKIFPEYQERKVIGAAGGIVIDEHADKYAYKKGFYVITESGENVRILNDDRFKLRIW